MVKYSAKALVLKNLSNIPGWRTKQKYVIIESDDWGSVRMPSNQAFENLLNGGIDLLSDNGFIFNKYDSLATSEDLSALFEVLSSVRDCTNRTAVLTPVSVVANPDFSKIRNSDFTSYFYEPFTETLKRYHGCENSYFLWKEGIKRRLFVPQFHGREHLNTGAWIEALQHDHRGVRLAFDNEMWGISTAKYDDIKVELLAAFDFYKLNELRNHKEAIISGLHLFEKLFGYRATYFVPPNGLFSSKLEDICFSEGIKHLNGSKMQIEPLGIGKTIKRFHWLGQKKSSGLVYITRNCLFEPSQPGRDWVDSCLHDISIAFKWQKPAIISSHRVNFIGALHLSNRDKGLSQLSMLLKGIINKWPDVCFLTSSELGDYLNT